MLCIIELGLIGNYLLSNECCEELYGFQCTGLDHYFILTFTSPETFMESTSIETSEGEGVDSQTLLCMSIHITTK